MSTDTTQTEPTIITRDGLPPLRFCGEEIGSGSTRGLNSTRWTVVTIYRTRGGRYITEIERKTCWQGERDWTDAGSYATAREALDSLRDDEGRLGLASQEAVDCAASRDPAWSAVWVEEVD